jgi:hypothetical protein
MAWLAAAAIALPGLLVDRFPVDLLLIGLWLTHQSSDVFGWLPRPRPGFLRLPWQTSGQ